MTSLIEKLQILHVWPQSIASTYADTLTPRQIERLYDVGNVATEATEAIQKLVQALDVALETLRKEGCCDKSCISCADARSIIAEATQ